MVDACLLSNSGVEICDGVDNDCNGLVDDATPPPGQDGLGLDGITLDWTPNPAAESYDVVRGDADQDGEISIGDVNAIVGYLFRRQPVANADAADVDDSGHIDVTDAKILVDYLFDHGAPPAPPFPELGIDPTRDSVR